MLSAAAIEQAAYTAGIAKAGEELTEGQKVQARYLEIQRQTVDMQGDISRTFDSVANQTKAMSAEFENASASIGESLLPPATKVLSVFADLLKWIGDLPKPVQDAAVAFGAIAAAFALIGLALPPIITGMGLLSAAIAVLNGVTWAQVAAFVAANAATGGLLIAVGSIITGLVLLVQNWDKVVHAIKVGVNFLTRQLQNLANEFIKIINKMIDGVNSLGGLFGKELKHIGTVEIPEFNTAVEEIAETVEETAKVVAKETSNMMSDYKNLTNAMERTAKDVEDAKRNEVEAWIKASQQKSELFQRERERNQNIADGIARDLKEAADEEIRIQEELLAHKKLMFDTAVADHRERIAEEKRLEDQALSEALERDLLRQEFAAKGDEEAKAIFTAMKTWVMSLPSQFQTTLGRWNPSVVGGPQSGSAQVMSVLNSLGAQAGIDAQGMYGRNQQGEKVHLVNVNVQGNVVAEDLAEIIEKSIKDSEERGALIWMDKRQSGWTPDPEL